jgi:hypothetical protein
MVEWILPSREAWKMLRLKDRIELRQTTYNSGINKVLYLPLLIEESIYPFDSSIPVSLYFGRLPVKDSISQST